MAFISACKSWMFKEGKVLFFLSCCQGILVAFVFAMDFKVDTIFWISKRNILNQRACVAIGVLVLRKGFMRLAPIKSGFPIIFTSFTIYKHYLLPWKRKLTPPLSLNTNVNVFLIMPVPRPI